MRRFYIGLIRVRTVVPTQYEYEIRTTTETENALFPAEKMLHSVADTASTRHACGSLSALIGAV